MRVCNVPLSQPFLRTVISALVDGSLVSGFDARRDAGRLSDVTLYLPTSRACRLARAVFLDVLGAEAAVLPRIVALGEIDEDELIFADVAAGAPALEIAPKMSGLERRLLLAQLIAGWAKQLKPKSGEPPLVVAGPASALALADDLARLIDDMITRQVDWRDLATLVPEEHDEYWQLTLKFLRLASEAWPDILKASGKIEAATRRDALIAAEAARLQRARRGPVIAAGSTGSMPATADFLKAIAMLPDGAVVLPGLDRELDDDAWAAIGSSGDHDAAAPSHPQFAMHALLERFGLRRNDVETLAPTGGRDVLLSEAMRPAAATGAWQARLADKFVAGSISAAMQGVAVVAAPNPEMEALAIAVAMREAYAQDKSAALVTPDRSLAQRVIAALGRWKLPFEDSGGLALLESPAGIFARLAADAMAEGLAPAALLALLKHSHFRLGRAENGFQRAIEALEIAVFRGTRPPAGSAGLARAFETFRDDLAKFRAGDTSILHRRDPRTQIDDAALDEAAALVAALRSAFASFEAAGGAGDLLAFAALHRGLIETLSADGEDRVAAFAGRDGQALATAFDELRRESPAALAVSLGDYPDVFETVFSDRIIRRGEQPSARLRILGTIEARLTQHDRVILGGLVESVWPPEPRNDPWLNRPMRSALKLDLPERRIGLSAHDFSEMMNAPEVILTRSAKVGGAPSVPSRFLHRLEAVAGETSWEAAQERGAKYLRYAHALDDPDQIRPVEQPQPKPPRELRPTQLSVTEIETWLRDPYSIYARHILKLSPLDPVDQSLSAADRGSAIHNAIGDFTTAFAGALPADSFAELRRIGAGHFARLVDHPEAQALWWPRFLRIAAWFSSWDRARRLALSDLHGEIGGRMNLSISERVFSLTGRADRIERGRDGRYTLLDYKTGTVPTAKQVRLGLSPQLTLEAAMLRQGAFRGVGAGASVGGFVYVKLSGANPAGREFSLELADRDNPGLTPDIAADNAREELEKLVRKFDDENTGYTSLNLSMWSNRYGDYDDLARIKEWSISGLGDEEW